MFTVSDPVSNLRVTSTGISSQLNVMWSQPVRPNGRITHYSITIYTVDQYCSDIVVGQAPRFDQTDDGTTDSKIVGGLSKSDSVSKKIDVKFRSNFLFQLQWCLIC